MATHVRESTGIQTAADICAAIASGLDSDPEAKHLAPLWDALAVKGDGLATQRRNLERKLARSRAAVTVMDSRWDGDMGAFGRDVYNASNGRRDVPPYTRFFTKVTASDVQSFGIAREVKQGADWIKELGRDPSEAIAEKWIPRLSAVNKALSDADKARTTDLGDLAMHSTTETLYIGEINLEIDRVEGDLKKLFPGQPKRVAAFLSPTRPRKRRSIEDESDDTTDGEPDE